MKSTSELMPEVLFPLVLDRLMISDNRLIEKSILCELFHEIWTPICGTKNIET